LSDEFSFFVCTRAHDVGADEFFEEARRKAWFCTKDFKVFYIKGLYDYLKFLFELRSNEYHKIYFNSVFSFWFSIIPILFLRITSSKSFFDKVIIAPRGELMTGALNTRKYRKTIFLGIMKIVNMYSNVTWHSSNQLETKFIKKTFGSDARIKEAQDLSVRTNLYFNTELVGLSSVLKLVFVSRITPKKNLSFLLKVLKKCDFPIFLTVVGPAEDQNYWEICQRGIQDLPKNISVEVVGPVTYEKVNKYYLNADLLALPTLGENFGHVFVEAMMAGAGLITSKNNIWSSSGLKSIMCEELIIDTWVKKLKFYFKKSSLDKIKMRNEVQLFIHKKLHDSDDLTQNIELFR
jgi:glycosyltransferase involved in cell wall biosynthesis